MRLTKAQRRWAEQRRDGLRLIAESPNGSSAINGIISQSDLLGMEVCKLVARTDKTDAVGGVWFVATPIGRAALKDHPHDQ